MMSLMEISAASDQQAAKAAAAHKKPYVPSGRQFDRWRESRNLRNIPSIGSHVPDGWEVDDYWAVSSLCWDGDGGVAVSPLGFTHIAEERFKENPEYGYAITEVGEFQLVVSSFCRI